MKRSGMTLLEVIAAVAIAGMFLSLAGALYAQAHRLDGLAGLALDRMDAVAEIETRFLAAVRAGGGVAPRVGDYESGPDTLVLRLAPEAGAARYMVWGAIAAPDQLALLTLRAEDGELAAEKWTPIRAPLAHLAFSYDAEAPENARAVTLDFALAREPGERDVAPMPRHRVTAAPRWRPEEAAR